MIEFTYPDGSRCWRPIHTVRAIYFKDTTMVARVEDDLSGELKTFEIKSWRVADRGSGLKSKRYFEGLRSDVHELEEMLNGLQKDLSKCNPRNK